MAVLIDMPKLSDTMTEGRILSWYKSEGDHVDAGDVIAEIESDKAALELECFEEGTLLKILVPGDTDVPIGDPIAIIGQPGEDTDAILKEAQKTKESLPPLMEKKAASPEPALSQESCVEKLRISPSARKMAKERGIDLNQVKGTGPDGRIIKQDIETYLERAGSTETESDSTGFTDVPLSSIRAVIAERLPQSLGPVPHYYLEIDVDAAPLLTWKDRCQDADKETKITVTDLLIQACATALQRYPYVNGRFVGNAVRLSSTVNIALAVSTEAGLLAPTLHSCESKSIPEIAWERSRLVEKAHQGKLSPDEMANGTFTISNLGMMGIPRFSAVINPPQAAILAVGSIRDEAVVEEGRIVAGKRMGLTLSCDHRVFDGAEGAKFLSCLKELLEKSKDNS